MSVWQDTTLHRETTTPLGDVETRWAVEYEDRPFYVVWLRDPLQRVEDRWIITAEDTRRPIKPTSKRGSAIVEMVRGAYEARQDIDLEDMPVEDDLEVQDDVHDDEQDTPEASRGEWHHEHSRDEKGVYTACGCFIPWPRPGKGGAVHGREAGRGRTPCPACESLRALEAELADELPLTVPGLLEQADGLLR